MAAPEVRAGGSFRVAGRRLVGVAMPYGQMAADRAERFAPGAFSPVRPVALNMQHDRTMTILEAGAVELRDTPAALEVRAVLPEGSAALKLVRKRVLRGLSVEFHARSERRERGVRVVERAELTGIALVDVGAYHGATAEVRARGERGGRLGTLRGRVPVDRQVDCRCSPGDCVSAIFAEGSLDSAIDKAEVLAITDTFSDVIASKRRGGVRLWKGEDGALEYAIDIPNNDRGKALRDAMDAADHFARPVLDADLSEATIEGTVARYSAATIRAMLVGPTDASKGWDAVELGRAEARAERERRLPRWL